MGSDTRLQRALGSLRGPHQSKNTAALQRLLAGVATQTNKQTKEILSLKRVTSSLIIITVQTRSLFELYVQRFSA